MTMWGQPPSAVRRAKLGSGCSTTLVLIPAMKGRGFSRAVSTIKSMLALAAAGNDGFPATSLAIPEDLKSTWLQPPLSVTTLSLHALPLQ
jgi:hypothetical protein